MEFKPQCERVEESVPFANVEVLSIHYDVTSAHRLIIQLESSSHGNFKLVFDSPEAVRVTSSVRQRIRGSGACSPESHRHAVRLPESLRGRCSFGAGPRPSRPDRTLPRGSTERTRLMYPNCLRFLPSHPGDSLMPPGGRSTTAEFPPLGGEGQNNREGQPNGEESSARFDYIAVPHGSVGSR